MGLPNIMKPQSDLLGEAGDRWMRSLQVVFSCGAGEVTLDGYRFEELALALRIRHLCMHPRSRDVIPGAIPADRFRAMIERNWSSIDSYGLNEVAGKIQELCSAGDITWRLA